MLSYANKRKKEKRTEILAPLSIDEPDGGVHAWIELGDRHPDFRYVIWNPWQANVKVFWEMDIRFNVYI